MIEYYMYFCKDCEIKTEYTFHKNETNNYKISTQQCILNTIRNNHIKCLKYINEKINNSEINLCIINYASGCKIDNPLIYYMEIYGNDEIKDYIYKKMKNNYITH